LKRKREKAKSKKEVSSVPNSIEEKTQEDANNVI